jgi:hypothetical protein
MRRRWGGIRLSKVNTSLLLFGLALLLVTILGSDITIDATQIGPGASWWQRLVILAVGVLAVACAVLTSRGPVRELWTGRGFLGAQPRLPAQLVQRPDRTKLIVRAVRQRVRPVAVVGIGGAGKSTLAAQACGQRRVRRRFKGGVTWLTAGPNADSVALLATMARRLGIAGADAGFTTVGQGQDALAAALQGKRVLIAVDNVWSRAPLDAVLGLGPACTVVFTTRKAELASTVSATSIEVDELTQEQALALLGQWTSKASADLPDEARHVCTRVGNLALGVAMAGAMVARGRSFADVLALIEQDLARVRADLDPEYQYATLRAAIEAGISDLPASQQRRYGQLAVFEGRGPFHRSAAEALWRPGLPSAEVGDLLAQLTGWSLLTTAGEDWYIAHDLQYEVLRRRLSDAQLSAAHDQLVEGYKIRYPSGWTASIGDAYLASALAGHLRGADRAAELRSLLTDPHWIRSRVVHGQLNDLMADYDTAGDRLTRQIGQALELSAPVLAADPAEVTAQLAGRLIGDPDIAVSGWAIEFDHYTGTGPSLVPVSPALTPPGPRLERSTAQVLSACASAYGSRIVTGGEDGTLRLWHMSTGSWEKDVAGHSGPVFCLAAIDHATSALAGGQSGRLEVWNLITGTRQREMPGHAGPIRSMTVTPDESMAITGGDDQTLRVWDLATSAQRLAVNTGSPVRSVTATSGATRAVTGGEDGTVRVWDLATGQREVAFPGHTGPVLCVAAAPSGTRAVTGGQDGTVRLWNPAEGAPGPSLRGHTGPVTSVAITNDARRAVTCGGDKTVRVWNLDSRKEIARWHGDLAIIGCIALPRAPLRVVVGQQHGQPYLLELRRDTSI